MKKFLLSTIIFSLVFAFAGIALAQELERIPSPDQIKNFRVIKKEGGALFGVRIMNRATSTAIQLKQAADVAKANASGTASNYEKIPNPAQISLFEKIKQIGTALWGIRKNMAPKSNTNQAFVQPVAAQCVKDAINKKDSSLKASVNTYTQSILSAVDVRTSCQLAAIDLATREAQATANKGCVEAYQTSMKANNESMQKAKNEGWQIYKSDLQACSALQKTTNATSTLMSGELNLDITIDDGENTVENIQ
ncbi:MAG: hypothetical protein WC467_01720 [Patescibacteria group bacterium]